MSEQNILATIDGVNITDADLDAYIANLPKEQQAYAAYPQFREHALKQLLAFHLYAKMAEEGARFQPHRWRGIGGPPTQNTPRKYRTARSVSGTAPPDATGRGE